MGRQVSEGPWVSDDRAASAQEFALRLLSAVERLVGALERNTAAAQQLTAALAAEAGLDAVGDLGDMLAGVLGGGGKKRKARRR